MSRPYVWGFGIALLLAVGVLLSTQRMAESGQAKVGPNPQDVQKVLDKALDYLKISQDKDGAFAPKLAGPGVTAITVAALLRNGVSSQEPVVAKGLDYLASQTKD